MRRTWTRVALLLTLSSFLAGMGCATVEKSVTNADHVVNTIKKIGNPKGELKYFGSCKNESGSIYTCLIESEDFCDRTEYDVVERTVNTEKTTSTWSKVLEYVPASLALAGGAWVMADAGNVAGDDDRLTSNPIGRNGAYGIGGGLLALGTAFLVLGIVDSSRAIDTSEPVGLVEIPKGSEVVACDRKKLANVEVSFVVGGSGAGKVKTTDDGTLQIDLDKEVSRAFIVGRVPSLSAQLIYSGKKIADIDLKAYQEAICTREFEELLGAPSLKGFQRFYADFPRAESILGEQRNRKAIDWNLRVVRTDCELDFKREELDDCLGNVRKLAEIFSGHEEVAALAREFEERAQEITLRKNQAEAKKLLVKAQSLLAKKQLDDAEAAAQECLGLVEDLEGCRKVVTAVEAARQKIAEAEERKRIAEEKRLNAWGKNHFGDARAAAMTAVSNLLKAPNSADWVVMKVLEFKRNKYVVHIVVDAMNSFGAMIRESYLVVIELDTKKQGRYWVKPLAVQECSRNPTIAEIDMAKALNGWDEVEEKEQD